MKRRILSLAMSVLMLAAGFSAALPTTASAAQTESEKTAAAADTRVSGNDTYTYYFLAPNSWLEANSSIGIYYWTPEENAAWPGEEMTAAPEIGTNVYKCEAPVSTTTIIFNDFVSDGTSTVNINTEGYVTGESDIWDAAGIECDDFNGCIYVLNLSDSDSNDFSDITKTPGEWFSLDEYSELYYKNYEQYYGSYGLAEDESTDTEADTSADTSTDTASDRTSDDTDTGSAYKAYSAGDTVTIEYYICNAPTVSAAELLLFFNSDYLTVNSYSVHDSLSNATLPAAVNMEEDFINTWGGVYSSFIISLYGTNDYFADSTGDAVITFEFTANKDFNVSDLGVYRCTQRLATADSEYLVYNIYIDTINGVYSDNFNGSFEDDYTYLKLYINGEEHDLDEEDQTEPADTATVTLLMGDVDDNGTIYSVVALLTLRYSAGLTTLATELIFAADVNTDGKVNSVDALFILRCSAGLSTDGSCGEYVEYAA